MKNFVTLLVAALIVAGGYGYSKNPKGCQKLGSDVAHDLRVIFTPPTSTPSTPSKPDRTAVAASPTSVAVASPAPLPVVAPASPAPVAPDAPAPAVPPAAPPAASAPAAPPAPVPEATPDDSSASELGEVVSDPGEFSYGAPTGWSVRESVDSKYEVAMDERRNGYAANINVSLDSYPNSLPEYIKLSKQRLAATPTIQNAKVVDEKPFATRSGLVGVRVTVLDTVRGIALQQVFYYFQGKGDEKFVVVCSSLPGDGARLEPTFDTSMKSFELLQ